MRVWEQPVRGVLGDVGTLALPGLERFRRGFHDEVAPPPVHYLTGLRPTEASPGRCVFAMPASPWLRETLGTIPLGVLAFLADAPLGGAAITGLGPGQVVSTSQLLVNAVRPVDTTAERLLAEAEATHLGRMLALAQGRVLDARGRLVATMSTRCFVTTVPLPDDVPPPTPPAADAGEPVTSAPAPGDLWSSAELQARSGLELLRAAVAGDPSVPDPPLHHLFGVRPEAVEEGASTWSMPATGWLSSGAPTMYGGALAVLADTALSGTAWTVVPLGGLPYPLDLDVRFLRPAPLTGRLTADAAVVHRGRTMVVTRAELRSDDGRVVALAHGSSAVVPLDVAHLPLGEALSAGGDGVTVG